MSGKSKINIFNKMSENELDTAIKEYKDHWAYKKYEQMNFKFADAEEQADEEGHP